MELTDSVARFSALANESRLAVFRFLIRCGHDGCAAGEISRQLGIGATTLSAQLSILTQANLITRRREGRSLIYLARMEAVSEMVLYLMEDCCEGRPEICEPILTAFSKETC
ncbi:metalloregulator ArsR/SmtB family transcription factor [Hyphomonas sp. FCG-A18]|uniref:ArsR/SmtB family transcription factor n=1 Tax=Hyphomonas sp. FCG-A18 TaxID=3080019 RepID=UPI002B2B7A14|nr:metalloregulator ArsR/SmtB family transcription factor [Hyphomonas sp. FCG-A18]